MTNVKRNVVAKVFCWALVCVTLLNGGCGRPSASKTANQLTIGNEPIIDLKTIRTDSIQFIRQLAPPFEIKSIDQGNGSTLVSLVGAERAFYTFDGTRPSFKGDIALGTSLVYEQPFAVRKPTIIRAIGVANGLTTVVRSTLVVPKSFHFEFSSLPSDGRVVQAVYVTGSFRSWDQSPLEAFKLLRRSDGVYEKNVTLIRDREIQYKFIVRYTNGEVGWYTENNAPSSWDGSNTNNIIPDPARELADKRLAMTDGMIDETAMKFDEIATAVYVEGSYATIRFQLLEGDAESISVRFGDSVTQLSKSVFNRDGQLTASYSGLLKLPSTSQKLSYYFIANDAGKKIGIGPNGLFSASGTVSTGSVFTFDYDPANHSVNGVDLNQIPLWAVDTTWYQIFPERFRNGDTSNDAPAPYPLEWHKAFDGLSRITQQVTPWTASWFSFTDVEKQTRAIVIDADASIKQDIPRLEAQIIRNRRYGGDVRGILNSIPYLKKLGVNGIYLNPIFMSDSEHKYDTSDYRHIDKHFGPMKVLPSGEKVMLDSDVEVLANERNDDSSTWGYTTADREFMQLVQELHANGMRVVIDGVFNHSAVNGPLARDVAIHGKNSPYYGWFTTSYEGDVDYASKTCPLSKFYADTKLYPHAAKIRFTAWEEPACNLINHRNDYPGTVFHPGLNKYFFEIVERWFAPKSVGGVRFDGIDGIRLDVYDLVPKEFWRDLRKKIKAINPDALIVAENWEDGYRLLKGDEADSLMNYRVRALIESWFMNTNRREKMTPSVLRNYVDVRQHEHREVIKYGLWSMMSSHDTDRVLSRTILGNRGLTPNPMNGDGTAWDSYNRPDLMAGTDKGFYSNDRPGTEDRQFFKVVTAFQMAFTGAPLIYYGDEVGMWGADDPTCRKAMVWADTAGDTQFETQCVQTVGLFCKENPDVRFVVKPDTDMFDAYSRFVHARAKNPALRRGKLNTHVGLRVNDRWYTSGDPEIDSSFLWAFERSYNNKEFIYFVSNQQLDLERQEFAIRTQFNAGTSLVDLITNHKFTVESGGVVNLTLARDRGVLLVAEGSL